MKEIAVFGSGLMGKGIAQVLVEAGLPKIRVYDYFKKHPDFLASSKKELYYNLAKAKNKDGKFIFRSRKALREAFGKISWLNITSDEDLALLKSCGAVIEALKEDLIEKKLRYRDVERFLPPDAFIFTNTSTICIDGKLSEDLQHPERFMGLHWFNPPPIMPIIEAIPNRNKKTNLATEAAAAHLTHKVGKIFCLAPDIPGFIVNRLCVPEVVAAIKEVEAGTDIKSIDKAFTSGEWVDFAPARRVVDAMLEGLAELLEHCKKQNIPKENIDILMKLGTAAPFGPCEIKKLLSEGRAKEVKFKMGPGRFIDLVGVDVALDCCKMLKLQEPDKWEVPELLERMLKEGKKGRKSGEGFYKYREKRENEIKLEISLDKAYAKIGWRGARLSLSIIRDLKTAFQKAESEGVKAVWLEIIRGTGANIDEFLDALVDEGNAKYAINSWHLLIQTMINLSVPIIVSIRSLAYGGACELAMAGDIIIAEIGANIGLPETTLGVMPGGGGTQTLPRRVGLPLATRMILRGEIVKVALPWVDEVVENPTERVLELLAAPEKLRKRKREALRYSFADKIEAAIEMLKARLYWLCERKERIPESFRSARKVIYKGNQKDMRLGLGDEWDAIVAAFDTPGAQERIRRFLEGEKLIRIPE